MENASLPSDVWNSLTTSSPYSLHLANIRDLALKIVYIIIGTVGVLDNLFVIFVFAFFIKITQKSMNILIVNQSVIDTCVSFLTLLTAVIEVDGTHMSRESSHDQFICRFWLTRLPLWWFLVTSSYGVLLMALERYAAVIYPVWYNNNLSVKKRLVYRAIAVIWIIVPTYATLYAVLSSDVVGGICAPWNAFSSYVAEKVVPLLNLFFSYLLAVIPMIICYVRIVYSIRTKVSPAAASAAHTAGRSTLFTSLIVCCTLFACWAPVELMFFLNFVGQPLDFGSWWYHLAMVLAFTNSCVNPFIYAAKYRKFQEGVKRMVWAIRPSQQPSQVSAIA